MTKSRDAFRTISEVSEWLDTPAHVLRFWESKFTQIKPVKRAGGRRYYRPEDMELLAGIKALLHEDGMTIKGVQKLLREQGIKHVATLGQSLESAPLGDDEDAIEAVIAAVEAEPEPIIAPPAANAAPAPKPKLVEPKVDDGQTAFLFDDAPSNVIPLARTAPAPTPKGPLGEVAVAIPALKSEEDYGGESRFYAAYTRASHDKIASRKAKIAPVLARLESVLDRISKEN